MNNPTDIIDLATTHNVDFSQLEELLGPEAFKLTPATMAAKMSNGLWTPYKHLLYLSSIIAHELNKGNARIIVSMPPRHGKSEFCSVWTPIWYLDKFPMHNVILLSYGADLAEEFSQKARDIMMGDADPDEGAGLLNPLARVRKDSARVDRFLTESGGGLRAAGLGGSVYGRGANLLLIDDYYKNIKEAASKEHCEGVATFVKSVGRSRLLRNGSILIVATRWPGEDLSHTLLKMIGSKYKEIRLPAEAELGDPLGRPVGAPLCPELITMEDLKELKEGMGSYLYSAMYQQAPKNAESNLFKREWLESRIVDKLPHSSRLIDYRSWDKSATEGGGDWTAGLQGKYDMETKSLYLTDMKHAQFSAGKVEKLVGDTAEDDGYDCQIIIPEDPGSAGKAVAERYVSTVLKDYMVKAIHHTGNKLVRALPFFAGCEHGKVYMLRGEWNDKFLDECVQFNGETGGVDDQIDAASQLYNFIYGKKKRAGTWGRKDPNDPAPRPEKARSNIVTGVTWGRR